MIVCSMNSDVSGIYGMSSLSSVAARTTFVLELAFLLLTPCLARERGPRVEVVCPSPPIPVPIDKNKVLVYELHVTNFDTVPLTLKHVEIFANEESKEPLTTLEEDRLSAVMVRVGAAMIMSSGSSGAVQDTRIIDPGGRNVVFVWIELPVNRTAPASLKHRLIFSSTPAGASNPSDTTLEDFQVPVSQDSAPRLSPPFSRGTWLAGDGPVNNSNHRRSMFAIDGHTYSPERFAIDWVKVGPNKDSRHDGTTKNENWWGWGESVLAVADGEITEVVDEFPDNTPRVLPPVTLDNIAGNHIILRIALNRFVTYAHLQRGSIKVRTADHVDRGDVLAFLGNSGNTTGAHLHLQVTDRNSVLQSQGVPFVFADFIYLGPGADYPEKQVSVPWLNSIPPGNGIVKFEAVKK
jgi:murein DD-endopeptidase